MTTQRKTILLVEDEAMTAAVLSHQLHQFGYDVIPAASGEEAISHAAEKKVIDLVLMDIHLRQGMMGTEAAKLILEKRNVPVVFLSSDSNDDTLDVVRGITCYGFVRKTADGFILESALEMALELFAAHERERSSEHKFRYLAENTSDVIWHMDSTYHFDYISPADERMRGFMHHEVLGTPLWAMLKPESIEEVKRVNGQRISDELKGIKTGTLRFELELQCKDGSWIWTEVNSTPDVDSNGVVIGYHGITRDISQRKRVEEELRQSEQRYRALVELSLEPIAVHGGGKILYVNPAAVKMFGAESDREHIGRPYIDMVHPDDRAIVQARVESAIKNGSSAGRAELRYIKVDGSTIIAEVQGTRIVYNGQPAVQVSMRDVTERKRAEESQAQQNDALANLNRFSIELSSLPSDEDLGSFITKWIKIITGSDMAVFSEYHPETRSLNPQSIDLQPGLLDKVVSLLGKHWKTFRAVVSDDMYREMTREIIGMRKSLYDVSFGAVPQLVAAAIQSMLGVDRFIAVVYIIEGKMYGTSLIALRMGQADPPRQVLENFIHLAAASLRRKTMEGKLRESEELFRSLYENSTIGLYRTTPDGKVLLSNPTLVKMLGYSSFDEIASKNLRTSGFEPTYERAKFIERIEADGEIQNLESAWTRKDGSTLYVRESARALRDEKGKTLYYDGTVEDITERKRLEQQLQHSQKLEGVGTLAGGIAHDFNNLLAMILGSAELLQYHPALHGDLKKYVDRIIEASERGSSITRQLLIFSRPDLAELKPISLSHIITDLCEMLDHFLPKTIAISTEIDADDGIIMGDAGQIHQALLNLALNAGDAMKDNGRLTIREYVVTPDVVKRMFPYNGTESHIAVSISDTGIGMDEKTRLRIFDPFFTTKEPGKGTGLGLGIVHAIVKTHAGFIDVKSAPGFGTTFTLYFPSLPHGVVEGAVGPVRVEATQSGTILVVDDEKFVREMLFESLDGSGYTVYLASNGAEALKIYGDHADAIDLVITDLGMPEMNGQELYRRLKAINTKVKVLVSSGYLEGTTRETLFQSGVMGIVTKPYRLTAIKEEIQRVLGK